jgi:hypothetical protein
MKMNFWLIFLRISVFVVLIISLSSCVSIKRKSDVILWSYEQTTRIDIHVPTDKVAYSIHTLRWATVMDTYMLTLPRGKASISAEEIKLEQKFGQDKLAIASSSRISIAGVNPCVLILELRDEHNKPYIFSGTYKLESISCRK